MKVLTSVAESCDATTLFSRQSENAELYRFVQYLKTRLSLMAVRKEDIHNLVERLPEDDQKTVFDFMQYLLNRSTEKLGGWEKIDQEDPDDEPLNEEELCQLNSDDGYATGEEAKREFGLQVELP